MRTITTLTSFIFIVNFCVAQPGTLDSSFGVNGLTPIDGLLITHAITLQQDGKILVVGEKESETWVISRFYNDGSIDETFGIKGTVETNLISHNLYLQKASSVVVQSDNKIIIGGSGSYNDRIGNGHTNFLVIRYNANGSIDESFGNRGVVFSDFGGTIDEIYNMILQKDGKIVAGGQSGINPLVVRYNTDGSLDTSFGNNHGWIRDQIGAVTGCRGLALQSDGKILELVGEQETFSHLVRYKTNGTRDSSFGVNGKIVTNYIDKEQLQDIAIQEDGKILAVGYSYKIDVGGNVGLLFRYNQDGRYDTSFGDNGKVITRIDSARVSATHVFIQPDKQIITTGAYSLQNDITNYTGLLIKYNKDGSYNQHFGVSGMVLTTVGNATNAALQKDGKLVLFEGKFYVQKLSRYNDDEVINASLRKNVKIAEGNNGTSIAYFEVVLNKISKKDVQVIAETKDVTAVAGEDYKPILRKVTIKAGSISASIDVKIKGDTLTEGNEKFLMVLSNPVNTIIGKLDTAVCTIEDDDVLFAINASSFDDAVNNVATSIKIYPNPVNNHLLLSGLPAATKTTLSIIDMSGNSRLAATVTGSSYNWNIGQLKAGSYILRIEGGGVVVSKMFVKE